MDERASLPNVSILFFPRALNAIYINCELWVVVNGLNSLNILFRDLHATKRFQEFVLFDTIECFSQSQKVTQRLFLVASARSKSLLTQASGVDVLRAFLNPNCVFSRSSSMASARRFWSMPI